MIYSRQEHTQGRSAITPREILAYRYRGGLVASLLVLLLSAGVLATSPSLFAQEQNSATATAAQKPAASAAVTKVNINTADAQTLAASLKGVGQARAMEIVRYREAYGPFASAEELTQVKGIGPSTLEMNRDAITLE